MSTPFPGMDPYLEQSYLWPDVHNSLIGDLRDLLAPQLRPRYYVSVEERAYIADKTGDPFTGRPEVAVVERKQSRSFNRVAVAERVATIEPVIQVTIPIIDQERVTYLEVRSVRSNRVITVIEILSHANKRKGRGRLNYEQKRLNIFYSASHLVEIDLLRANRPMFLIDYQQESDYRILVSRAEKRPKAELLPFNVRSPIPTFDLPLQPGDEEPLVDLGQLLHDLYNVAGYDLRIDYRREPTPRLSKEDALWADKLLREAGWR
ncbi:MAG: DUF4058 family protein [Ardenticatenaceae bacterium]